MTTPTQNDIPSSTATDVRFNAEKLDEIVNSDNETYEDRFGNARFTLKGLALAVQSFFSSLITPSGAGKVGVIQGGTVQSDLDRISPCYLSYYGADQAALLSLLGFARNSGREVIIDEDISLTSAVTFDAQNKPLKIKFEATIYSDSQLLVLNNLGRGSVIENSSFKNITVPYVISRWDADGNWLTAPADILASVTQTNEEVGYQPTASDSDVWSSLSAAIQNQTICSGFIIGTSKGVTVKHPTGRYTAVTFKDCYDCSVENPDFMGGKHTYGSILFNNTGTSDWGSGNRVIGGTVRYGSVSGVTFMRHKGENNGVSGFTSYRCGESGLKTYQNNVNNRSARCYNMAFTDCVSKQCYYDGFDFASDYGTTSSERLEDYSTSLYPWNLLPLRHKVDGLISIGCHGTGMWGDGQYSTFINCIVEDSFSSGTNFVGRHNTISKFVVKNCNRNNNPVSKQAAQFKVSGQSNDVSDIFIYVDDPGITEGYGIYIPSSSSSGINISNTSLTNIPSFSPLSKLILGNYSSTENSVSIEGHPRGSFLLNPIGRLLFELSYGLSGSERGNASLQPVYAGVFVNGLRVLGDNGGTAILGVSSASNASFLKNGECLLYESAGVLKIQYKNTAGVVSTYALTAG